MAEKIVDLPYQERRVGEHTYKCSRLLLSRWIELEALLLKVLGVQVLDLDESNLGSYAPKAIMSSTAQDHEQIFALMGECVSVKNDAGGWGMLSRETQERWWTAYIKEMPAVIGLFFEVQLKDFFIGLETLLPEEQS